jgi:hypothetical protein
MIKKETKEGGKFSQVMHTLKTRWGVDSLFQVVLIFIVFGLAGMSVVLLRRSFFSWLGFDNETPAWLKTIVYVLFIFPSYQVLLLIYGALLGQFTFFWEKEKKLVRWILEKISRLL